MLKLIANASQSSSYIFDKIFPLNCQSLKRGIKQSNVYRIGSKLNKAIRICLCAIRFILYDLKYYDHIALPRIFVENVFPSKRLKFEKGHLPNSVKYLWIMGY